MTKQTLDPLEWLKEGTQLLTGRSLNNWAIGDWAAKPLSSDWLSNERNFYGIQMPLFGKQNIDVTKKLLKDVARRSQVAVSTIIDLRGVSERIPVSERSDELSWCVHREISRLVVKDGKKINESASLILRREFIVQYVDEQKEKGIRVRVRAVHDAVRKRNKRDVVPRQEKLGSFSIQVSQQCQQLWRDAATACGLPVEEWIIRELSAAATEREKRRAA